MRFIIFYCLIFISTLNYSQNNSRVREELQPIKTYPYNDPDPNPILIKNKAIYPYHSFDGYSLEAKLQSWKVVTLENDFIKVLVLPEIGGKVFGAIEKSTGHDFIYKNDAIKFRNISMRGPWTSGGIEFNFGIIGHSPATASPVDYKLRSNSDGSVSCIVGNIDLPSRTKWTVEIRLPKDKAYFETNIMWNNPTALQQDHYNFVTAAAAVTKDAEFLFPGNKTMEHGGKAHPWPVNENGIDMAYYANDTFGSHNSFHTVGLYQDFMGGYYHDKKFGFGHWAKYEDMPGRKLWLWGTARDGAIWEDLLTDHHGQYLEFQAGRSFTQYSYNDYKSPIKELPFNPGVTDRWKEIWYPIKDIDGLKEVSPNGLLNVTNIKDGIKIGINSLGYATANLLVKSNGTTVMARKLDMKPMDVKEVICPLDNTVPYEVMVEGMDLHYRSVNTNELKRPFVRTIPVDPNAASHLYQEGMEMKIGRNYESAKMFFLKSIGKDPTYIDPLVGLAELYYRSFLYDTAMMYAHRVLQLNTYHPAGNYFAGLIYRAQSDYINALESFGWAARDMGYRSFALAQMAEIHLIKTNLKEAESYALNSLDFNQFNLNALKALTIIYRKHKKTDKWNYVLKKIQSIDPLDDFVNFEYYNANRNPNTLADLKKPIRNEFAYQTYLELSSEYLALGQKEDALKVLSIAPSHPNIGLWKAYLTNNVVALQQITLESPAYVFPFRQEDAPMLEWAVQNNSHWSFKYYRGLIFWNVNRNQDAYDVFKSCGSQSDYAPFYTTRASLAEILNKSAVEHDLIKAKELAPSDWRTWSKLIDYYNNNELYSKAIVLSDEAYNRFKNNFIIGLLHAKTCLYADHLEDCLTVLSGLQILPFEGSTQGKQIYEQAWLLSALKEFNNKNELKALAAIDSSRLWPEKLGVGRPYNPDERLQDGILAGYYQKINKPDLANQYYDKILSAENNMSSGNPLYDFFSWMAMKKRGLDSKLKSKMQEIIAQPGYANNWMAQWTIAKLSDDQVKVKELNAILRNNKYFTIIDMASSLFDK